MSNKNHPGWAIQFKDGRWLAYGHGYFKTEEAYQAKLYKSVSDAEHDLWDNAKEDISNIELHSYDIILGWEPLCNSLRIEVEDLRNVVSIDSFELFLQTETIKTAIKEIEKMNKSFHSEETTNKDKE